jgi:hypothetical protein
MLAKKTVSPKPIPTTPLRRIKDRGTGAMLGNNSPLMKMVRRRKAIATMPLIKFSCNGGMRSPKRPYTTDAIAHKQAADNAAISPSKPVNGNINKILKIIYTPFQTLKIFHIFKIYTFINFSTQCSSLLIFEE